MRAGVLAAALVLGVPGRAAASQCQEVPFARQLKAADVVFVGEARTIDGELATTFAVERVYKGSVAETVVVETGRVKYAMLSPPGRYLVLAVLDANEAPSGNPYVRVCSGSLRAPWPDAVTRQLGEGKAPTPVAATPITETPRPGGETPRPGGETPAAGAGDGAVAPGPGPTGTTTPGAGDGAAAPGPGPTGTPTPGAGDGAAAPEPAPTTGAPPPVARAGCAVDGAAGGSWLVLAGLALRRRRRR